MLKLYFQLTISGSARYDVVEMTEFSINHQIKICQKTSFCFFADHRFCNFRLISRAAAPEEQCPIECREFVHQYLSL